MKITDVKPIAGTPKANPVDGAATDSLNAPKDRVSVQATKDAEAAVAVARAAAGGRKAARAERLEAEVRSGGYRPDPGRVAEQILSDAEVDARISAMLRR